MSNPPEEWQRLPKGIRIWTESDLTWLARKGSAFFEAAKELKAEIIVTPILGFAATFERAIETTGEKTYEFADRKGRRLMLSPDSSPHVVRWFLENHPPTAPKRVLFISPIFRYRHIKDRFWLQFGLASFNEGAETAELLAEAFLRTLNGKLGLASWLQVGDLSLHWSILSDAGAQTEHVEELLHRLRPLPIDKQLEVVDHVDLPRDAKHDLKHLLGLRITSAADARASLESVPFHNPALASRIVALHEFAGRIAQSAAARHELVFNDFHGSELQRGVVIKFRRPTTGHFADGGDYTFYGRKLAATIKTFWSFGGGLLGGEPLP